MFGVISSQKGRMSCFSFCKKISDEKSAPLVLLNTGSKTMGAVYVFNAPAIILICSLFAISPILIAEGDNEKDASSCEINAALDTGLIAENILEVCAVVAVILLTACAPKLWIQLISAAIPAKLDESLPAIERTMGLVLSVSFILFTADARKACLS